MALFNKKLKESAPKKKLSPKEPKSTKYSKSTKPEDLKIAQSDLDKIELDIKDCSPDEILFAKLYILCNGNGTEAYVRLRNGNCSRPAASVAANRLLRKLRSYDGFWDMLNMGYDDLHKVVEDLKLRRPEKAADIIMKVNKEDTERIEGNITVTIANELTEDYR